jgi:hypothetical protein
LGYFASWRFIEQLNGRFSRPQSAHFASAGFVAVGIFAGMTSFWGDAPRNIANFTR